MFNTLRRFVLFYCRLRNGRGIRAVGLTLSTFTQLVTAEGAGEALVPSVSRIHSQSQCRAGKLNVSTEIDEGFAELAEALVSNVLECNFMHKLAALSRLNCSAPSNSLEDVTTESTSRSRLGISIFLSTSAHCFALLLRVDAGGLCAHPAEPVLGMGCSGTCILMRFGVTLLTLDLTF